MKSKKSVIMITAILLVSLSILAPVKANTFPSLPPTPVTLVIVAGSPEWPGIVTLSAVPAGFDVTNSPPTYTAWCAEFGVDIDYGSPYWATLISSLDLPTPWDKINYLLNNKAGDGLEIQAAIWLLFDVTENEIIDSGWAVTTNAKDMYNDANSNGGFYPTAGQLVAVKCVIDEQDCFIELEIPEDGTEGLTPGFWKNCKFDWVGYSKGDSFNTIFGTAITINQGKRGETSDPTFDEALSARDGINEEDGVYDALARHAVAALLNAAHPDVNYPMTELAIKNAVAEAINNGASIMDAESLKDKLESYNMLGGGIDAHGNPI